MNADYIENYLESFHYAILCYEYGKLDDFIAAGNISPHEDSYSCFFDILNFAPDFYNVHYNDDFCVSTFYICYDAMMEYYRLCRVYSRRRKIPLKENPFMREAERYVESAFDYDSYGGYAFLLQTKVNHKWASGIVVKVDENCFNDYFSFAEAVLSVGDWYGKAVERLKKELAEPVVLQMPETEKYKEAA